MNNLIQKIKPVARSIKYGRLLRKAQSDSLDKNASPPNPPVSFIFGCGRSGTTILGKLLDTHDDVIYLFEPYHLWRAILPETDMIQLYGDCDTNCILDGDQVPEAVIQRFNSCMAAELKRSKKTHASLIEKTPINAMRIPLLSKISPKSQMLHLARNGIDVVRSIDRLASTNTYQLSGKGDWNQWWGRDHCKWKSLCDDSIEKGYFVDEIESLTTNIEVGALEWLVSLIEINLNQEQLGNQLLEVSYNNLTENPKIQLTKICNHFGIKSEDSWLDYCSNQLDSARKNQGDPIVLPPKMCEAFNAFQDQYGFDGQAIT